jgi:hypothetical protein
LIASLLRIYMWTCIQFRMFQSFQRIPRVRFRFSLRLNYKEARMSVRTAPVNFVGAIPYNRHVPYGVIVP